MIRFAIASIVATAAITVVAGSAHAGGPGAPQYTDAQLLAAAYNGPRVYAGGYADAVQPGQSLYYVSAGSPSAERCTNDLAQARAWATPAGPDAERENEKFFEFRQGNGLVRVHKCTYAEPGALLGDRQSGAWGKYNGALNSKSGREFAEYAWFIRNEDWLFRSLLDAERTQGAGYDEWRLHFAAHTNQTIDEQGIACDEISFIEQRVRVDRSTRDVTMTFSTLRTVQGICEPPLGG